MSEKWYIYRAGCCGFGIIRGPRGWDKKGHPIGGTYGATLEERGVPGWLNVLGFYLKIVLGDDLEKMKVGEHREITEPDYIEEGPSVKPDRLLSDYATRHKQIKGRDYTLED